MKHTTRWTILALAAALLAVPAASAADPLEDAGIRLGIYIDIEVDPESITDCIKFIIMEDNDERRFLFFDNPTNLLDQDKQFGIVLYDAKLVDDNGYYGFRWACPGG